MMIEWFGRIWCMHRRYEEKRGSCVIATKAILWAEHSNGNQINNHIDNLSNEQWIYRSFYIAEIRYTQFDNKSGKVRHWIFGGRRILSIVECEHWKNFFLFFGIPWEECLPSCRHPTKVNFIANSNQKDDQMLIFHIEIFPIYIREGDSCDIETTVLHWEIFK